MSLRVYVNGVQIFGNNEMYPATREELTRQGAKWNDGCFDDIEIKDPQSLMEAVEKDVFGVGSYFHNLFEENKNYIPNKDFLFSEHDKDDKIHNIIWDKTTGELNEYIWLRMRWFIEDRRIFTSYELYQAIKNDVIIKDDLTLELKPNHKIIACRY